MRPEMTTWEMEPTTARTEEPELAGAVICDGGGIDCLDLDIQSKSKLFSISWLVASECSAARIVNLAASFS